MLAGVQREPGTLLSQLMPAWAPARGAPATDKHWVEDLELLVWEVRLCG